MGVIDIRVFFELLRGILVKSNQSTVLMNIKHNIT